MVTSKAFRILNTNRNEQRSEKKMYFKYYVGDTTVPRLYVCHISGSKSICLLYMFRLTIQIGAKLQNKTDLKDIYCL